jgi:hypothetical protein
MATKAEIRQKIRAAYPDLPDSDLRDAVDYFIANPEQFNPRDIVLPVSRTVLEGGVVSGAKAGAAAVGKVAKTFVPRTKTGKVSKTKIALGVGGLGVLGGLMGGEEEATTQEEAIAGAAQQDMMMQLAMAQAQGIDVESLVSQPLGQALLSSTGLDPKILFGANTVIPTSGGVYLGKQGAEVLTSAPPAFAGGRPVETRTIKDTVSTKEWSNMFPIGDPKKLSEWKNTLVKSGVVSASAGLTELRQQWDAWGELSQQMNRMGNKLTPNQLLEIQRGLWGGGGADRGPSYSTSLIKTENAMAMFKQGIENLTGRVIDDTEAEEFAKLVRKRQLKKPTKTSVQVVDGKKVTVTDPGFGEAEAAALVERRAQKDPMFAEFQTANVFGSALEKALGVRG